MNATTKADIDRMIENPGIYICGDTQVPRVVVVVASMDETLYQMKLDGELDPTRFLDTFVIKKGPCL